MDKHGITADGRGWTHTNGAMPRATNAYWTDPRPVSSALRYQDSKIIPMPIVDADWRAKITALDIRTIDHEQSWKLPGDKD